MLGLCSVTGQHLSRFHLQLTPFMLCTSFMAYCGQKYLKVLQTRGFQTQVSPTLKPLRNVLSIEYPIAFHGFSHSIAFAFVCRIKSCLALLSTPTLPALLLSHFGYNTATAACFEIMLSKRRKKHADSTLAIQRWWISSKITYIDRIDSCPRLHRDGRHSSTYKLG